MCTMTIGDALFALKGVQNVTVHEENQTIDVQYVQQEVSPKAIRTAISKVGYDADHVKANKKAYKQLHGCCKKPEDQ